MSASLSLVSSYLGLLSIFASLYGMFFCLFAWSIYLSANRQERLSAVIARSSRRPVWQTIPFVASIILFITITPLWFLNVYESFEAFIYFDAGKGPSLYYSEALPAGLAVTVLTQAVPMIGDSIMIYRLFIISNRSKIIVVLPLLALAGVIALDVIIDDDLFRSGGFGGSALLKLKAIIPAICTLSLFVNLYCCAIIAWKFYHHIPSSHHKVTGTRVTHILAIFIESAALYAVFMIIYVGVYASGAEAQVLFGSMIAPIIGIAFTLINVRVSLGYEGIEDEPASTRRYETSTMFAEGTITPVTRTDHDVEPDACNEGSIRRR